MPNETEDTEEFVYECKDHIASDNDSDETINEFYVYSPFANQMLYTDNSMNESDEAIFTIENVEDYLKEQNESDY